MNNAVLYIGADLSVNGGIATVLKSYYAAYTRGKYSFDFIMLKTTDYQHGSRLSNAMLFGCALLKMTFLLLGRRKISIVHIKSSAYRSFQRKVFFVILAKIFRRKVIFHLHSGKFEFMYETGSRWTQRKLRTIFKLSDQVITLSESLQQITLQYFPEVAPKLLRIPNPVALPSDFPVPARRRGDGKFHILYLGYLLTQKGIRELLTTAQQSQISHPDWVFDIAGKGELQDIVAKAAKRVGSNICYHGWADAELRDALYRQSDIFILPSYVEGMPLGILEAMSYGLPIVATHVGGIPDITGTDRNVAILITPQSTDEMISALTFFGNVPQLERSRQAVNQRIVQFGEDTIYKKVVAIYKELSPQFFAY